MKRAQKAFCDIQFRSIVKIVHRNKGWEKQKIDKAGTIQELRVHGLGGVGQIDVEFNLQYYLLY